MGISAALVRSPFTRRKPEVDTQTHRGGDFELDVGRVDHGGSARDMVGDHLLYDFHRPGIERGERFIKDPQRGLAAQREPRQGDAAALPLREHARGPMCAAADAKLVERRPQLAVGGPASGERARNGKILGCRKIILDGVGVTEINEPPPELLAQSPDILALPAHRAGGRRKQAAQDAQQACLAAAICPGNAQQLAPAQLEVKPAEERALATRALEFDCLEHQVTRQKAGSGSRGTRTGDIAG